MSFLLDTNVLCEPTKIRPDSKVLSWFETADEDGLFLSAVTLAELFRGARRLPLGRRRQQLERWLDEEVTERFGGRILPVDIRVAAAWGSVMVEAEAVGRPMNVFDGLIAATAKLHRLTLVTRNTRHFDAVLSDSVNPWSS
jgi:predicted nucleic acid-binding protein